MVYLLVRFGALLLSLLPLSWALSLGRICGRVAYALDRRGRTVALRNLRAALPDEDAEALARKAYRSIGMVAVEIALLPKIRRRFEEYVELPERDLELLRSAYAEGRGVIFVTGHVGNWELLAQRVLAREFDGATVARDAPNPFIGQWLVRQRTLGNLETINRGEARAARKILGALKRGALLGVLIDQDTRVKSVMVPFFNRPAATPVAAAELALKRRAPVVVGFIRRRGDRHQIRLERVSLEGLDAAQATARLTEEIEAAIRAAPEEWVWFHDRWKTKVGEGR